MSPARIAFLDVDGTILDHGRAVQNSTVAAVRAARAAGHLVYLSTGRSASDIHPTVREIGFDGAITNGGAYATSGDETVVARPMPRDAVTRLLTWFEEERVAYFLQTDDAVYASAKVRALMGEMLRKWQTEQADAGPQTAPQKLDRYRDISEADLTKVAKAVFIGDSDDIVERAQNDLGESFHVVPGSMPMPGGTNGEIAMRGTTKGSAITAVLDHVGMSADEAIGIGDSWNDVEMFEVCGTSIAMGNAAEELKALADEVTTSVRDHGVANAFRRHGLA